MKKLISTLLILSMILTFAACASEPADNAGDTAAAQDTAAAETTTEPAEYTAPEGINYDGAEFVVAAYQFKTSSWKLSDYCEIYAEEENGDPINDAIYKRNRIVEEELNVKFDRLIIPAMSQTTEMTTPILAGEDAYRFASANATGMPTMLANSGMLTDIGDLQTLTIESSWWDQKSVEEMNLFGKQYAMTGDFCFYNKGAPITLLTSMKMVEDLNLDNPYQLVRDGAWTHERLYEFSNAAARDLDGDGQMLPEKDSYGFMGEHSTVTQFIRGSGQRLTERDPDGNIKPVINTEKTASIVEQFIPFIRNKDICIYAQDYSNQYKSVYNDLMLARFIDNAAMFYANQLLVALNLRDMESDFGILPLPKYNESQDEYYNLTSNSWCTYITVPVTNPELDMTGHILNSLGYHSQQIITPAFIDQTVMDKAIRDEDSAEMLELIFSTQVYDIGALFNWGNINSMFSTLTSSNNTNFASEYAKIEPSILAAIEKTIDQLG